MKVDKFDLQILDALQKNARLTTIELSEQVGLSPTPCGRRVRMLEEEGLIDRYVTLLNAPRLGVGLTAFINIRLRSQTKEAVEIFEKAIKTMPEIMFCYLVTGNYDYLLMLRVANVEACKDFIRDRLIIIESVGETQTSIALEETKFTTAIPLPAP